MSNLFDLSAHQDPKGSLWRKSNTVVTDLLTEGNNKLTLEANPNGQQHGPFYYVMTLEELEQRIADIRAQHPGERVLLWQKADQSYGYFPGDGESPKQCGDRRVEEECPLAP